MTTTTYNLKQKIETINTSKNEIKSAIEDKIEACIGESYEILGNIQTYANEIGKIVTPNNQTLPTITENGTYEYNVDTYTGLNNVTVNVNQSVQDKIITENGTYNASEGYIGLGEVTVNVENPPLITKNITRNGTYKAEDDNIYGYDEVVVNVTGEFLVQVIDYDGTVLKSEMLNEGQIFTLPDVPTHSDLVFQEWSSPVDIEDNTVTVGKSDIIIGAIYTTTSGLSEFDITLTQTTGLTFDLNMNGTKDWGDGTSDTNTSHTYANIGNYTITCNGSTITAGTKGVFRQDYSHKNYSVTNVRLSSNIVTIPDKSFMYCSSLQNMTLSKSTTYINAESFYQCTSLQTIIIPNNITNIGNLSFSGCSSLKNIVLSKNISIIENQTFYNCVALENIILPESLTDISTNAFSNCLTLKKVFLPNNITNIGEGAFSTCYSLENITMPNNITNINEGAFLSCFSLKNINLLNKLTKINDSLFRYCYSLESTIIPEQVTQIDENAFSDCQIMKNVKILGNVNSIGSRAFYACSSIIEYDFSEQTSVPTLSNINAFYNINAICKIKVPISLESEWKSATNWSTYANYIVGV